MRGRELQVLREWEAQRVTAPPYFYNRALRERLYRAAMPAVVIWGAADRMVPRAYGEAYVAGLPGAAGLTLIAGAGHSAPLEQLDATADALMDFLGVARTHAQTHAAGLNGTALAAPALSRGTLE